MNKTDKIIRIRKGRCSVTEVTRADEVAMAQALRARCFGLSRDVDADRHDLKARHFLIHEDGSGVPVGCFRLRIFDHGTVQDSYAGEFYDLTRLTAWNMPMLEIGRFCIAPGSEAPDLIRLAWAAITQVVDAGGIALLFGCSSFEGTAPDPYLQAFSHLKEMHQAPVRAGVARKSGEVFGFETLAGVSYSRKIALQQMPPLLRSYLSLGAWVSDHAVIDRQMNTLHVFTALEVARIPPARQRLLRALV